MRRVCAFLTGFFHEHFEEGADGAAHFGVAAVDDAEGADEAGAEFGDFDFAFLDFFFDDGVGDDADAAAEGDGFLDHLEIIEVHDEVDFGAVFLEVAVDVLADGEIFIEADEIGAIELGGGDAAGGGEGMAWGHDEDHLFLAPGGGGEFAIGEGVADDADIGAFLADGVIDFFGAEVFDLEVGIAVAFAELALDAVHLGQTDGIDRGDADFAAGGEFEFVEFGFEFGFAAEDFAAEFEVGLAGGGEADGAGAAVDEVDAEAALQLL